MKALMIGLDPSAAGVEKGKYVGNLQDRLVEYGKHVDYIYFVVYTPKDNAKYKNQKLSENIEVFPSLSSNMPFFMWEAYRIASKICRNEDIDIINVQDPIFCGIVGLALKYRYKKPLLVQVHGDTLDNKYWLMERKIRYLLNIVGKFVLKRADGIRVVGERVKKRIMKMGIQERRIFKLPIYIDTKKFSEVRNGDEMRRRFSKYDNIVLFVGRLAKEKNLSNLFKAAAIIIKKFPRVLFLICGDGPERKKLEQLAKKLQIEQNVIFEGLVEHDRVPAYYKVCDIFVLPSNHEGWGLVLIEALAAGKPVVTTDVGCASDLIIDGKHGYIVPRRNAKVLVEKIIQLLQDPIARHEMGIKGQKLVMETQDLSKNAECHKRIYSKVLEDLS